MSGRFLFLQNTVGLPTAIADPPIGHEIAVLDQYALSPKNLDGIDGLLLGQHLDERHLTEHRDTLDAYLEQGGAIAVMGPVALPFLTHLAPHEPVGTGRRDDWLLELGAAHPIMAGVDPDDLTYRKGVVGFWARGSIAPPDGAHALTRFTASGVVADWAWSPPAGGRLFVHPGNDVWGYAGDGTTAARVFPQLLDWMMS